VKKSSSRKKKGKHRGRGFGGKRTNSEKGGGGTGRVASYGQWSGIGGEFKYKSSRKGVRQNACAWRIWGEKK